MQEQIQQQADQIKQLLGKNSLAAPPASAPLSKVTPTKKKME